MLRFLEIIATCDPAGGGPIEGIRKQHLICKAHPVAVEREIATLDPAGSPFLLNYDLPVFALGTERVRGGLVARAFSHYHYSARFIPWLRSNISRYDAAIVHGLWNYAAFGSSHVLPLGPVPYFVFVHGMMDPWFGRAYPLKHIAKSAFWLAGEGRLMRHAQSALFTTQEERDLARGQFPLWRYNELVVPYGAAPPPPDTPGQRAAFAAAAPTVAGRPYLLFLSRIHEKKGCDLLVDAFGRVASRLPSDMQLVIAGPDEQGLVQRLQRLAEKRGVGQRIHWPGMLSGDAKWGAFRGADAFVLPSHQENFGIAVAEALACGTPVLISNKVNIWPDIKAAGAGFVAKDTQEGTVETLSAWAETPGDRRAAMRAAALALFDGEYNLAVNAPKMIDLLKGAL